MNRTIMLRAAAFAALLFVAFVAVAGEALPGLAKQGKLVVGLDDTFAPMGFRDPANNLVGFDIDLAREVGKQMGVEIVFQPIEWSAKEMELATKNIDCIWNGMSRTPEREAGMTLSQNYLNNRLAIMVGPGAKIDSLNDLAGYQVGTQAGSSALAAIKKNRVYSLIEDNIHEYATYDECLLDMQAGRIQAMVVDQVLGQYKNKNLEKPFEFAAVDFGDDFYAIGFRRETNNAANEQVCKAVENAIKAIIASGKGEEISKKWFGANLLLNMK